MNSTPDPLRIAVVGARRGQTFINASNAPGSGIRLVAVCDQSEAALQPWQGSGLKVYTSFDQVLGDREIDAVCIATPVPLHARQSIAALEAGKHVLSEVTACYTLEEGWDLIAAVEHTGRTYMMAENYCYTAEALQVLNMVEQGVFGELTYAFGAYLHDCRDLYFTASGDLTWRGKIRREMVASTYPTHSLGPVARWMGINRTDFLESTATWQSKSRSMAVYAKRNFPGHAGYGEDAFWPHPDTTSSSLRTRNGALIDIRVDWGSARPHQMMRYELQGTKAAFVWPDGISPEPLIWIQDRSPTTETGVAKAWEPLSNYREEFEHPLWREHRQRAEGAGHGGGDFFILREFVAAIAEQRPPMIDVYDAVTWSALTPLSQESIAQGNVPVRVPNFKGPRSH